MAMNMKTSKKMKGFMCHSQASTGVCMSTKDYRPVIVPRNQIRLVNNNKYIRLGDQPKIPDFVTKNQENYKPQQAANSLAISDNIFQVVVMRVSIHCQGCAGKIKKHISKMEGVTSFSVDLESKRVTVMGHVSPSGVLESISRVKKAEFWP